jgi:putative flippase GtrA
MMLPNTVAAVWSAKAGSYTLGVLFSFIMNSRLTFRDQVQELTISGITSHTWLFVRFLAVSLLCLVMNSSVYMYLAGSECMQLMPLLVATAVSFIVGFTLNHTWTYRGKNTP